MAETKAFSNDLGSDSDTKPLTEAHVESVGCCQTPRNCRGKPNIHVAVLASLWHLLTGIERASVIPTLYLLLSTKFGKDTATSYYGIILAAFGMSVLFSTPIFGYAASRGVRVKILLYISNFLEIVGNLIYLFSPSPLLCFLGRFIAGAGAGCESPLYADIVRCTEPNKRTPYIISLALGKELGLFAGPIFTIFFNKVDIQRSSFELNVYNAPGLFMAVLWVLHTVALTWYPIIDTDGNLKNMRRSPDRSYVKHLLFERSVVELRKSTHQNESVWRRYRSQIAVFYSYPLITMIICIFSGSFNAMCLEGLLPAVATRNYNWTELEISYTYIGIFGVLLVSTFVFFYLSKMRDDRSLTVISFGTMSFAYACMTVGMILIGHTETVVVITISLISIGIHAWSMPGVITLPDSLYSKLAPLSNMDVAQAIARFTSNAAFMLGLYIGGQFVKSPAIITTLMFIIGIVPVILILAKYDQFNAVHYSSREVDPILPPQETTETPSPRPQIE